MKYLMSILICISLGVSGSAVLALSFNEVFFLQDALNKHGFDAGPNDGQMGRKTRNAAKAFGLEYLAPQDPERLLYWMMSHSNKFAEEITDELHLENIKSEVAEKLRDPSSAMLRNVYLKTNEKGNSFICGEVNGKNAYGGYAGYTAFMSIGRPYGPDYKNGIYMLQSSDNALPYWWCALAFPKRK